LTGGPSGGQHITDITNASRTMLFNIRTQEWDDYLLEFFGIPASILPEVRSSAEHYGNMVRLLSLFTLATARNVRFVIC